MKKKITFLVLLMLGLSSLWAQHLAEKMSIASSMEYQYLLYLPEDYHADTACDYPLKIHIPLNSGMFMPWLLSLTA